MFLLQSTTIKDIIESKKAYNIILVRKCTINH